jgi:hypothetical protein
MTKDSGISEQVERLKGPVDGAPRNYDTERNEKIRNERVPRPTQDPNDPLVTCSCRHSVVTEKPSQRTSDNADWY